MMQSSSTFPCYYTCITTFVRIIAENVIFANNNTLDKMIIYDIPYVAGDSWNQIRGVCVADMLIFACEIPDFFLPNTSLRHLPHYTNPPLPGIVTMHTTLPSIDSFLASTTRTSTNACASSNVVTSTTRSTTSRANRESANEEFLLMRRLIQELDSCESSSTDISTE